MLSRIINIHAQLFFDFFGGFIRLRIHGRIDGPLIGHPGISDRFPGILPYQVGDAALQDLFIRGW